MSVFKEDMTTYTGNVTILGSLSVGGNLVVTGTATIGGGSVVAATPITNSLSGDIALNATSYFDGPSIAQGTSGTWFASGTVTITDTATGQYDCKLWDGTTVIASARGAVDTATAATSISLSGFKASPAANIKISVKPTGTTGTMRFNISGNSKDSTVSAIRIA